MSARPAEPSCGTDLSDITRYLAGDNPAQSAHIETCAQCQDAIRSLQRLEDFTHQLAVADTEKADDPAWFHRLMSGLHLEGRPGRSIPYTDAGDADLAVTEGAVRALVRAAADTIDGALIGQCVFTGDVTTPGSPVEVNLSLAVIYGHPIQSIVHDVRTTVDQLLRRHTELVITDVNITVIDVIRESRADPSKTGTS
ncbi:Asp23/Gls24 family envelope stress response protein [Tersicoccus sp. Bi-70]|uniref:Asp23/Gls24 family envelope stress response protein n=1 Tax=Tersicoccus sp. Bi-70 TaxID=1897634 RepID=UPI00117ED2CA|nr:Asp23/Gls24 family envelope stress response protein [Tersicoccus sp. Bi-70]